MIHTAESILRLCAADAVLDVCLTPGGPTAFPADRHRIESLVQAEQVIGYGSASRIKYLVLIVPLSEAAKTEPGRKIRGGRMSAEDQQTYDRYHKRHIHTSAWAPAIRWE